MIKQLVFIDDSGDPGFKQSSSDNFVMSAIFFDNPKTAEAIMREIVAYRKELGWKDDHEFKFSKNSKRIIIEFLKRTSVYDFYIYAAYLTKKTSKNHSRRKIDQNKLYSFAISELLNVMPLSDSPKIVIDGRSSRQNMHKICTYLRHSSRQRTNLDIHFRESDKTDLLQLADLVAGAINRSLQANKTDSKSYINILRKKVIKLKKLSLN